MPEPTPPADPAPAIGPPHWAAWGGPETRPELPGRAGRLLLRELGVAGDVRGPVSLAQMRLPPAVLPPRARTRLATAVGEPYLRTDRATRVAHAGGKSYLDLLARRAGDAAQAPDAVVAPASHDEVAAVLTICDDERIAVVPFGGGTSVVGGVEPLRASFAAVISLDVSRLRAIGDVDETSLTVTCEPGLRGVELEDALAARGLTLGHFPQSAEQASIGGYVATRSAGQASTGYGRIDDLVVGVRLATPAGELRVEHGPASASGPELLRLVVGSEGILGVITEVTLAVRRAPATKQYEGWVLPSFAAGAKALRELVQAGDAPDVARLSDASETRLSWAQQSGLASRAARAYLRARRRSEGCITIVGIDGDPAVVRGRSRRVTRALRAAGGVSLGERPGAAWRAHRFAGPYLRDTLLDHGVLVETVETAARWRDLLALHERVGAALHQTLEEAGTPPLVACHISHLYPHAASLYFTVLARQDDDDPVGQWQAAKRAATDAIVAGGGTITHHHAVGRDHRDWLRAEIGDLGVAALRAVKDELDPNGICNPAKLLPEA